jgi:L-ascorbate metabolism protein UlaG (beta-lactamase superfamily)
MSCEIRYFGVGGYEIIDELGRHILIDPFLDENPGSPIQSEDLDQVDLILVSHAAWDHLGDTEAIARRTGAPVLCGGEVKAYLTARGIPGRQVRSVVWGLLTEVDGIRVQPVESHHWSQIRLPDGTYACGVPMGFIIHVSPEIRFYHWGDTALFSDLKLIGELYRPTIGCVGVSNPAEVMDRFEGPGHLVTGEMSPREAALAARWLGLKTVLPCHYINPDCEDVREFDRCLGDARDEGHAVPEAFTLSPGDALIVDERGQRVELCAPASPQLQ